ncbi:MAG: class I SAM-dependent methyltransferase [Clostridiales bacterium]|nr:MAG: class I SAM-dependent methyltransferase [Clostridiales bacterium]
MSKKARINFSDETRLIIQPMIAQSEVRRYLSEKRICD